MVPTRTQRPQDGRLYLLILILFVSYLCVAMSLPVVPLMVTGQLGLANGWAGLAVGIVFLATILSRGPAGRFADARGTRPAALLGLGCYVAGALISALAGLAAGAGTGAAFALLLAGRLAIGLGESLVAVAVIGWGIGLAGPERAGRVMALVGAAIYGGFAAGGPAGMALHGHLGFAGTMAAGAVLPLAGIAALACLPGIPPAEQGGTARPGFAAVLGRIRGPGAVVGLQGIGFAAIGAFFPLYFLAEGWDGAGLGLTAFGTGFVLVRLVFGGLPDRLGGLPVAIVSLAVEAAGQFLAWSAPGPGPALLGAFLTGLGCSLIFPGMGREVVRRVPAGLRATALGGFAAFQDLAYGLTGPLAGILADHAGYRPVFLCGMIAAGLGLSVALGLQRTARAAAHS
ncbi:MFS transporter [Poseidonocella sp. HB161398]|uniref:MFS transporter n=1 Tax=Poseidonocella sp. HB161398 TaxID=2320855 RepID=UPI001109C8B8|nr:MFS transporter [Poseidonocella sp. HB161398]